MTTPEQLRDDVRFLAGAVERQRRFYRAALTPAVGIVWAVYVFAITLVNSIGLWEYTHSWARYVGFFGLVLALALTVWIPWRESAKRGEIVEHSLKDLAYIFLPWLACGVAVILVSQGIDARNGEKFLIAMVMVALTAVQIGLTGSAVMLGVGVGGGIGLLFPLSSREWGLPLFGLSLLAGVLIGAVVESRRARR